MIWHETILCFEKANVFDETLEIQIIMSNYFHWDYLYFHSALNNDQHLLNPYNVHYAIYKNALHASLLSISNLYFIGDKLFYQCDVQHRITAFVIISQTN